MTKEVREKLLDLVGCVYEEFDKYREDWDSTSDGVEGAIYAIESYINSLEEDEEK